MEKKLKVIYPLTIDFEDQMKFLLEEFYEKHKEYFDASRLRMDPEFQSLEVKPNTEIVEAFFLMGEMDERIGMAALNLIHTRGIEGQPETVLNKFCDFYAEVKEVRRLNIM